MRARWPLLVASAATAAALGFAVDELASGAEAPTTTTVCIKPNGQLRAVTAASPACVAPEVATDWTVNGVKAITAGEGLVGRADGGLVQLQVDPGLIENANSGKIVAGFDDGPHEVPDELSPIAQLPLQPGNYAIFAKLVFRSPPGAGADTIADVTCKLFAGADVDQVSVVLEPFDAERALFGEGTNRVGQTLEVVHRFDAPSRALLFCGDKTTFPPFGGVDGRVVYDNLKIVAIRGSSLSNTFVGLEEGQ
jgi:hypothetical protein